MHKRVRPGLKLDLVLVEFTFTKKEIFCALRAVILDFFNFALESSKLASYLKKET